MVSVVAEQRCKTPMYQQVWATRQRFIQSGALRHYIDYLDARYALGYSPSAHQLLRLRAFGKPHFLFQLIHLLFGRRWTLYSVLRNGPQDWRRQQCQQQDYLLQQFSQKLHAAHSIAVVGNSPSLKQQHCGTQIDEAEVVFRFNHAFSHHTSVTDTGSRTSYWMVAPDFKSEQKLSADFAVLLSGAAPLNRLHQLQPLSKMAGTLPVLQVPIHVWRQLYQQLQAPPSAGLLVLFWLRQLGLPAEKIRLYGFSTKDASQQTSYHHALPGHQPSKRHHWAAEALLLSSWFADTADEKDEE